MLKNRQEPSSISPTDKATNFSERAAFALRSLVSPSDRSAGPYNIKDPNHDKSHVHPYRDPESDSPVFNISPKHMKKTSAFDFRERTPFNAAQGPWQGASSNGLAASPSKSNISNPNPPYNGSRSNSPEKPGFFRSDSTNFKSNLLPTRVPHALQNLQEDQRGHENYHRLPALASPKTHSKAGILRSNTFSNTPAESSAISSSQMLQNNARGILNISNSHNDHNNVTGLQNRTRFQSHNDLPLPSYSPPKTIINNPRESPLNTFQPSNEIGLLKFTIKPPPPAEPDPFEEKKVQLAQPLSKLYSLVKNSPQKPIEPRIDYVALSMSASKNECALKKAKSIKNIMYREGRRDPNARYKPKFKFRVGIILWVMVYPYLLKKLAEKLTKEKQSKMSYKARQAVKEQINHIARFIRERCMKSLELIYSETKELSFISQKDKLTKDVKELPSKKLEKAKAVSNILISVLQGLVIETSNEDLPKPLLEYLASISEDSYQIPSGLLFDFELSRLEFNQFLALKNMTPSRSKMIIGMFFIVRMLIFYFLTQPWAAKIKIKETPLLVGNMQISASILYHVVMDYFREKIPILPGNMDSIPEDRRVGPRDGPFVAFGDQAKHLTESRDDDVIIGLFSKDALAGYFLSQPHAVRKMKSLIEEWLEEMYSRVHIVHVEGGIKKPGQE